MAPKAEYLFASDSADVADLDLGRRTLECTKPAFALKPYLTLATLGEERIAGYLENAIDLVADFADEVARVPDFELAHRPDANFVCFRHLGAGAPDLDALQRRVREAIVRSGRFFLTRTRLGGRTWLRCTVLNPATKITDLRALLVPCGKRRPDPAPSAPGAKSASLPTIHHHHGRRCEGRTAPPPRSARPDSSSHRRARARWRSAPPGRTSRAAACMRRE